MTSVEPEGQPSATRTGPTALGTPRRRIQDAAIGLFVSQGYRGTSVKDITRACGLTPGALYNHFPSKESLLYAIVLETHVELDQAMQLAADPDGTPEGQLRSTVHAFALFHQRHRNETLVANLEYVELTGDDHDVIVRRRRSHRARFEKILEAGVAGGVFDLPAGDGLNDVKLTTTAIVNMAIRLSEIHGPGSKLSDDQLAAFHAELAVRMVTAPRGRRR